MSGWGGWGGWEGREVYLCPPWQTGGWSLQRPTGRRHRHRRTEESGARRRSEQRKA